MRQIGTLPTESDAKRFTAYLITESISVHAEQEGAEWAIWIRDENQLEKAREEFSHFREHPNDVRYEGVEQQADPLVRCEAAHIEKATSEPRLGRRCCLELVEAREIQGRRYEMNASRIPGRGRKLRGGE